MFEEKFWIEERPCFVKEEKKVLDTLYALLIVSSDKMKMEILIASKIYAQKEQGINDPILKLCAKVQFHSQMTGTKITGSLFTMMKMKQILIPTLKIKKT